MLNQYFKSDILFTGYYGQLNTGDDAFVEVACWGAKNYWKKQSYRFMAKNDRLPSTQVKNKGYPICIPKTYKAQRDLLLSSTKCLISAGGSTFHHTFHTNDVRGLALKKKLSGNKLKIGAIGVSIGPFKSIEDEKYIKEYLKHMDFLTVRDQKSFSFLESLELPYEPIHAFDLAGLLPEIYPTTKETKVSSLKRIIGVSICPVESISNPSRLYNEKLRNVKMVELIKNLNKKADIHFKFFIINGNSANGDLKLTKEIIKLARPQSFEIINYQRQTLSMWNSIASCDFVVATRLHAAIFSCFSNTPFILHEYHRKCRDFLDDIGYQDDLRVYNNEYSPINTSEKIIEILENKKAYKIPVNIEQMSNKAALNFLGVDI